MRVVLPDAYFEGPIATAELHAILLSCVDGPHLLESEPLADFDATGSIAPPTRFRAWVEAQGNPWNDIARIALERGIKSGFAWQPKNSIRLSAGPDDWTNVQPALQPQTAVRLLTLPLKVVVEDAVNDGHFLRAVTRPEFAAAWKEAESAHWLEVSHGGGITSAPRLLSIWQPDLFAIRRRFCVFDSDARVSGKPSPESERLRAMCVGMNVPFHQLKRRSIENYIPMPALNQWARNDLKPKPDQPAVPIFEALSRLPTALRHFFNYKRGRDRDRLNHGALETTMAWRKVSISDRSALRSGLHNDIASLFDPTSLTMKPRWLAEDDVDREMFGMVKSILSNL